MPNSTKPPIDATSDVALFRIREHCHRILSAGRHVSVAAAMTAQMFLALDASLSTGEGTLPLDWSDARRNLIVGGLPSQPSFTGFALAGFAEDGEDDDDAIEV